MFDSRGKLGNYVVEQILRCCLRCDDSFRISWMANGANLLCGARHATCRQNHKDCKFLATQAVATITPPTTSAALYQPLLNKILSAATKQIQNAVCRVCPPFEPGRLSKPAGMCMPRGQTCVKSRPHAPSCAGQWLSMYRES